MVPALKFNEHVLAHSNQVSNLVRGEANLVSFPNFVEDTDYSAIYKLHYLKIKPYYKSTRLTRVYNFQIFQENRTYEIIDYLKRVYEVQQNTFKTTISLSVILKKNADNELCFYESSCNNQLILDEPFLISNYNDFTQLCETISNVDLSDIIKRPNTKYTVIKITNITIYITLLMGIPIGASDKSFPSYLLNNKGLMSLVRSKKTGIAYKDNLCLFRCAALHLGYTTTCLEEKANQLFLKYVEETATSSHKFKGVQLCELNNCAKIFGFGINVYEQDELRCTSLIYRTISQENVMNLNKWKAHFSYIKDFPKFSSTYRCTVCDKIWFKIFNYKRHIKTCVDSTTYVYPNEIYKPPKSIFEKLEEYGINVPAPQRFFEFRICLDIEAMLSKDVQERDTDNLKFVSQHQLASISVCSNVQAYSKPRCFVSNGSPYKLVEECLNYMIEIADKAYEEQLNKFKEYTDEIAKIKGLWTSFIKYLKQVPVLTFNGGYQFIYFFFTTIITKYTV